MTRLYSFDADFDGDFSNLPDGIVLTKTTETKKGTVLHPGIQRNVR
jgi:hypothetical protein